MSLTLPDIIGVGVFDKSLNFPNVISTPERITKHFEIELPLKNGGYTYLNDKRCEISPNSILCIKPGITRHTTNSYNCYYIRVAADNGEICDTLSKIPNVIKINNAEEFKNIFINMIKSFNPTKLKNNIFMYSELLRLINMLSKTSAKSESLSSGKSEPVVNALQYLNDNYLQDISLNDIAKYVHLSPIYFRELFVKETGVSPHTYILNKRINQAKTLLKLNCTSMSEVAISSGFSSQSYFNYVFKKQTGITPKQYKINNNNLYFQK